MNTKKEIWEKDRDHFIHPWMDFSTFNKTGSDIITKGEGIYVYDIEGNKYIDGIGGLWCVNIGHGRTEMKEAISKQLDELEYFSPFTSLTNIPASQVSAKIIEVAPSHINHVFYSSGGSSANDSAIKIAHLYFYNKGKKNKKKVISRYNSYHGSGFLASALTGTTFNHLGWVLPENLVYYISEANLYRMPQDSMDEESYCNYLVDEFKAKILDIGAENIAAFIAEPIVGAGGILVAPQNYHKKMYQICLENDILYIADEVVTSFGRLGQFFSSEDIFEVKADMITTAKGLTSGYLPLGATLISDKVYEYVSKPQAENGLFTLGFTYSGHPVCTAAALKNIEIIEKENLCEHVRNVGDYFEQKLKKELSNLPIVGDVRGKRFMMGIEQVANKKSKELFPLQLDIGKKIANECKKRGLIVRPIGHLNILSPCLTMTQENCDELINILKESIIQVSEEIKEYIQ